MNNYDLTPAADNDLDDIAFFIAKDNVTAALEVLDSLRSVFEMLADNPALGTLRTFPGFPVPPTRAWPLTDFRNYIVYYRESENGILIVRVLHAARQASRELASE